MEFKFANFSHISERDRERQIGIKAFKIQMLKHQVSRFKISSIPGESRIFKYSSTQTTKAAREEATNRENSDARYANRGDINIKDSDFDLIPSAIGARRWWRCQRTEEESQPM